MDAFYASVELLRYPELRGKAVVIGGGRNGAPQTLADGSRRFAKLRDYAWRGVVTTSTYEARALGVFSAMGMMKAAVLAPDAILLPTDFDSYRHYSRLFKAAVATFTDRIEDRGIDEFYIDLTELPGEPRDIAARIKQAVNQATGLTCSICVAPNKLLAKIGSELDKPDGLAVLREPELPLRVWPLPVGRIHGIGPKAAAKLGAQGIRTIGELAARERHWLVGQFGRSFGGWLHDAAHGRDDRPLVTHSDPVSMSRETTFERDLHAVRDRGELGRIFTDLALRLATDLQRRGYAGRTIGVKLRFDDFSTVTRERTLAVPPAEAALIRRTAGLCQKRVDLGRRLRLLGVRVSALSLASAEPPQRRLPVQADLPFTSDE